MFEQTRGAQPQDQGTPTGQGDTATPAAPGTAPKTEPAPQPGAGGQPGSTDNGASAGTEGQLFAGKYKTVDELVKGYKALERFLGQRGVVPGVTDAPAPPVQPGSPAQPPSFPPQADYGQITESFRQSFETDPLGTLVQLTQTILRPLQEQAAQQSLRAEAARLTAAYSDFALLGPRIAKLFQDKPYLQQFVRQQPELLEGVYLMAKAGLAGEVVEAAKQAGHEEEVQAQQERLQGTTVPTTTRQDQKKKTPEEELTDELFGQEKEAGIFG